MAEAVVTRVIEIDVRASAAAQAHIAQTAASTKKIEDVAENAKTSLQRLGDTAVTMGKALVASFVAEKVLSFASAINTMNDAQRQMSARLEQVTGSSEKAGLAFSEIVRISREQGREMEGTGKLYEKIARQQEQLGLTTRGVTVLTEGFASSLRLSGTNTQEANAAMLQFSQALASGKLAGDEFRSLMENNSVFMYRLAEAAGVTAGDLKKLSKDGAIDLESLRSALFKTGEDGKNALERMRDDAGKLPKTFAMAVDGVKAALQDYLNALGQTATQSESFLTRIAKKFADSLGGSALLTRAAAIQERALAELQGKTLPEEQKDKTITERVLDIQAKKRDEALDRESFLAQKDRLDADLKSGFILPRQGKGALDQINAELIKTRSVVIGWNRFVEEESKKAALLDAGTSMLASGWKAPDKDEKEKKGPARPENSLEHLAKELNRVNIKTDENERYKGAYEIKAEQAFSEIDEKYRSVWQEFYKMMVDKAQILDAKVTELNFGKLLNKATIEQNERDITRVAAQMDHLDKLIGKHSPFDNADRQINALKKERDENPNLTYEQAVKYGEACHALRETAARELMGTGKEVKGIAEQMADSWETSFDRMTDSLISFDKSSKEIIGDLVISLLRDLAKLELKEAMAPIVEAGRGLMKSIVNSIFPNANGAVFSNGVRMMANGGILDRPTFMGNTNDGRAQIAGEAGHEAVMPLRRGSDGKLGVGTAPVTVVVNNNASGTRARTEETTDSSGNKQITVIVEELVEAGIGSGRFDKVFSHAYDIRRKGK